MMFCDLVSCHILCQYPAATNPTLDPITLFKRYSTFSGIPCPNPSNRNAFLSTFFHKNKQESKKQKQQHQEESKTFWNVVLDDMKELSLEESILSFFFT